MRKSWMKGAALVLAAVMCASALGGCAKKAEAKPVYTFNGEAVDADLTTFLLRYSQAGVDETYGTMFSSYYGQSMWTLDLSGTGEVYETTYKNEFGESLRRMLLAEEHAGDYGVELTDEEKAAITEAASKFLADNDQEALDSMSATQETVEKALTLYTLQSKVEKEMTKDVDTNVSDEEAAQKTVSYIGYTPTTEAETEAESETEADLIMTEAEEAVTEAETAAVETEEADKTSSADETEAAAVSETEAEPETEDPALAAAKEKYSAMAEEKLAEIQSGAVTFEDAAQEVKDEGNTAITASSYTFGDDDTYPAAEIREAVEGLEDGTLVDHIVESNGTYYILHMDDAFNEAATEHKKEEIVAQRRNDMINEAYNGWIEKESWETDAAALALISLTDRVYSAPEKPETEADEAGTEAEIIAETEADAEAGTEADLIAETEAE